MAQVIDASLAVGWCVRTQSTELSEAALDAVLSDRGHVPAHFWFEVLHGVARAERRGNVTRAFVDRFVTSLSELPLTVDAAYDAAAMVQLSQVARRYTLSIYDAAYFELAVRLDVPLATRDSALIRAAKAAGVPLFNGLQGER